IYDTEANQAHRISDGMSDARFAQFDKDGKHLYFTASTNMGLTPGWIDMSSLERPVTRSVYVAVLRKDLPSPLAPESDEEKAPDAKPADAAKDAKKGPEPVRIDLDRIGQRILALPIPAKNYVGLIAGKAGVFFLAEQDALGQSQAATLHKFDMKTRKLDKVLDAMTNFDLSANGEKMLYSTGFGQGQRWFVAGTGAPVRPGDGPLKTEQVEVWTDPRAEWKQMYNEVWRLQRDFFYDPKLHGLNLADFRAKYEKYVDHLASRADLNYLFQEMLGNITVGHLYIGGGALPDVKKVQGGLLGADYVIENGRYRFARVYDGENWNPDAKAPLTQPGVNVTAGEYLLAVDGRELRASDEVYALFEGTAGKSVVLKVGPNPDGSGAREVTVVPVASDTLLRYMAWIEDNRRKVDQLSGGKLAYVHLPNTTTAGYTNFNRFLLAQIGREGAVIDERFNGGGQAADYIVDYLRRPLLNYWSTRYGEDITTPVMAIFGPKAMIVNEFAGSGGDAMPWYFRKLGIGPLIGKRTWGGLVGILGFPQLMDGGTVTAPNFAFWSPKGDWDVENYGVAPDIEVELDPKAVREGRDPQLEKAVEVVMTDLKKNPLPKHQRPPYPNYHDGTGRTRW
ncbi:MAG TPA: protease, partial [Solibacterales bacterium]|nr:protease [Bryobacterales bacterium]